MSHARPGPRPLRVLLIDDQFPFDALGAGFPRARSVLDGLAELSDEVHFWPMAGPDPELANLGHAPRSNVVIIASHGRKLDAYLAEQSDTFDLIWISRPKNMKDFLSSGCWPASRRHRPYLVYDAEAIYAERQIRQAEVQGRELSACEKDGMRSDELELARRADMVVTVSEGEAAVFRSAGIANTVRLSAVERPDPGDQAFERRTDILFLGAIHGDATPNADAVAWYSDRILPPVRRELGGHVRLKVAGINRSAAISGLDGSAIDLLGPVARLGPLFNAARVFVAPTRFAAGIPLKVLSAAAHGVPVVATELLAEQLGWTPERDLLTAPDENGFARQVVRLYRDRSLWSEIRANALARVSQDASEATFRRTMREVVEHARVMRSALSEGVPACG